MCVCFFIRKILRMKLVALSLLAFTELEDGDRDGSTFSKDDFVVILIIVLLFKS